MRLRLEIANDKDDVIWVGSNSIWLCPYQKREIWTETDTHTQEHQWTWRQMSRWRYVCMPKNPKDCQQTIRRQERGMECLPHNSQEEASNPANTLISTSSFQNCKISFCSLSPPIFGTLLMVALRKIRTCLPSLAFPYNHILVLVPPTYFCFSWSFRVCSDLSLNLTLHSPLPMPFGTDSCPGYHWHFAWGSSYGGLSGIPQDLSISGALIPLGVHSAHGGLML